MSRTSKNYEREVIHSHTDADGNYTEDRTVTTSKVQIDDEPDFIKIYTKMWLEYNQIPSKYRQLFFSLACRMSYCKAGKGQLVNTGKPYMEDILEECGWKTKDPYMKGLKALCDCNAIKRVGPGVYQVNPSYAGRGEWKYNPRLERGGVKDLRALFEFGNGTVSTQILWADDGSDTDDNEICREEFQTSKKDEAVVTVTRAKRRKKKGEEK